MAGRDRLALPRGGEAEAAFALVVPIASAYGARGAAHGRGLTDLGGAEQVLLARGGRARLAHTYAGDAFVRAVGIRVHADGEVLTDGGVVAVFAGSRGETTRARHGVVGLIAIEPAEKGEAAERAVTRITDLERPLAETVARRKIVTDTLEWLGTLEVLGAGNAHASLGGTQ